MRATIFLAAMTLATLAPRASFAQGEDAEALVREGIDLRKERRHEEALERFRRASAIAPSARTQAQIGLAEQALGRWVDAERDVEAALTSDDAWIAVHRDALVESLAYVQNRLAWVDVKVSVAGAHVFLDGTSIGTTPLPSIRVVAGTLTLDVRADGYVPVRRFLEVAPSTNAQEDIHLVASETPAFVTASAPNVAPSRAVDSSPSTIDSASRPASALPIVPIALGVAGAVGLGLGTYWGVRAMNDHADENRAVQNAQRSAAEASYSDGRTSGTLSTIAFTAGFAFAASGAVWWLLTRSPARGASARIEVTPVVGATMNGLVMRGAL